MAGSFVWFDLRTSDQERSQRFYERLLGWEFAAQEGSPTMLMNEGGPWALVADAPDNESFWLPYVQVDDVEAATKSAVELGATVRQEKTDGPGGTFSVIADPTGAEVALWQPAA
jgi:predicted enzyme related to lactoylglutathione lyase